MVKEIVPKSSYTNPLKISHSQALIATGTDTYYGKQGLGDLGVSTHPEAKEPIAVPFPYAEYNIKQLLSACTGVSVLIAQHRHTKTNYLFGAGNNSGGVLHSELAEVARFVRIDLSYLPEPSVRMAAVGSELIVVQTMDNNVYMAGNTFRSSSSPLFENTANTYKRFNGLPLKPLEKIVATISDIFFLSTEGVLSWFDVGTLAFKNMNYFSGHIVLDVFSRRGNGALVITNKGIFDDKVQILPEVKPEDVVDATCNGDSVKYAVITRDGTLHISSSYVTETVLPLGYLPNGDCFSKLFMSVDGELIATTQQSKLYGAGASNWGIFGTLDISASKVGSFYLISIPPAEYKNKIILDVNANTNSMHVLLGSLWDDRHLFQHATSNKWKERFTDIKLCFE